MFMAGDFSMFLDAPSLVIVLGGSFFAAMAKFGLGQFLSALRIAGKSFVFKIDDPNDLIEEIVTLADMARKGGLLSLEGKEVNNKFLEKGIQLLVDGHDPDVVRAMMSKDRSDERRVGKECTCRRSQYDNEIKRTLKEKNGAK